MFRRRRSKLYLKKYITWELISMAITFTIVWLVAQSLLTSLLVVCISIIPRCIMYHVHEKYYEKHHRRLFR